MTSLTEFTANVKDIARPNRFLCEFTGEFTESLPVNSQFLISKATIPKLDIKGPDIKYRGTSMAIRGDYKKDPLAITFWNDTTWKTREFFENWLELFVDFDLENIRTPMSENRFGHSVIVSQFAGNKRLIGKYEFFEAVPYEISEMALSQTDVNTLQEFSVTFQYAYWKQITNIIL